MTGVRRSIATLRWLSRTARRAPLTVVSMVVLWSVGAGTGSLLHGPPPGLLHEVGAGFGPLGDGHWWFFVTSALWCSGLGAYLGTTALLILLVPMAEWRLGSGRAAVTLLVLHVLGSVAGLALVEAIVAGGGRWARHLATSVTVGPAGAVIGLALVAGAGLRAAWRYRLRVMQLIGLATFVLYSGHLADVLALTTGLTGLVAGMATLGRRRGHEGLTRPEVRLLVGLVVAASAVGPLIAVFAETRVGPLAVLRHVFASPPPDALTVQQVCDDPALARKCVHLRERLLVSGVGPAIMSVMPVVILLAATEGLRRGRRAAWAGALGLNLALGTVGVLLSVSAMVTPARQQMLLGPGKHLHFWLVFTVPVLQQFLVAGFLVATKAYFTVRAPAGTYRKWGIATAATLLITSAEYVTGSLAMASGYNPRPDLPALLADLPARFIPPGYLNRIEPAFLPVHPLAAVLYGWTGVLFWTVVAVGALVSFTRTRIPAQTPADAKVRELLSAGGSSLSHMVTWPGHRYWFTADKSAAVAYRVIGRVAITTGDPIGEPGHHAEVVRGFARHCQRQGWTPCLYCVGAEVAAAAGAMEWSAVQVAEESVLPLAQLRFTGKKWQDVRTAINRAHKTGLVAQWCPLRDTRPEIADQIRVISHDWLARKELPALGFTLGDLDTLNDPDVRLLIAVDAVGTVHAVTSWLPVRRDGDIVGWTLDFMRRRADALPGTMEFLIASAALHCQREGAEFLSLSGVPLTQPHGQEPAGGLQHLIGLVGRALDPLCGFGSLLAFKAKFQPVRRPLYLAYSDSAALPAIARAIRRAYLPHVTARQATHLARSLRAPATRS
jgi:lysylphosphatidylglycerol synthetase-like protein (DUF2156 family)